MNERPDSVSVYYEDTYRTWHAVAWVCGSLIKSPITSTRTTAIYELWRAMTRSERRIVRDSLFECLFANDFAPGMSPAGTQPNERTDE